MKAPVCEICLRSGLLCRSCDEKVKNGIVSETEVKVAGLLLKMSEDKKPLREVTLVRVAESDNMVVIVCGRGDAARFIGSGGQTVRRLEKELGHRVMIAEEAGDIKEFITNLVKPVPVLSINTLYKNGEEALRVVTGKGRGSRISPRDFSDIVRVLYGRGAELSEE
jgi:transcription antitermination factor NusA-like protein